MRSSKILHAFRVFMAISTCVAGYEPDRASPAQTDPSTKPIQPLHAKRPNSQLEPVDLSSGGLCLTIDAPSGATVSPSGKGVAVRHGDGFRLYISPVDKKDDVMARMIDPEKKKIRQDKDFKISVDTNDTFIAGLPILGKNTYKCYVRVTVGNEDYWCVHGTGSKLTEAQAILMAECAKTLKQTEANKKFKRKMAESISRFEGVGCQFKPASNILEITGDKVTDADLEFLRYIPQAHWVVIIGATFTPTGLSHLKDLPNLDHVTYEGKQVTDAWLESLIHLPKLQSLWLRETSVASLKHAQGLVNLEELKIRNALVGDEALKNLVGLTNLRGLELEETKISDAGMETLNALKSLQNLKLTRNSIGDAGVEKLKGFHEMFKLDITDTSVSPAGVAKLQKNLPKCKVVNNAK
jgi:hypothetical protein